MNGKWTYSDVDREWANELFDTKEEAINEARLNKCDYVGQLSGKDGYYVITNIEPV